ncbi:hypothetical protein VTJ83DRAFT_4835 [Remersonia thermophila]|uniref:Homeobox protein 4 n=1 Tax=Remersonia thermophila TaxID=72144 RepID=A0ABR4DB52_9PEZI
MDEFVAWDPAADPGNDMEPSCLLSGDPQLLDFDLALANADGDDFSFWAIQHFENNVSPLLAAEDLIVPPGRPNGPFEDHLEEHFESKCTNCRLGGYDCKRIPEGQYKGYCTSCVALRCACSFSYTFELPYNPWPLMGDHPRTLPEDLPADAQQPAPPASGAENPGEAPASAAAAASRGKAARFSREAVKILKNWLSTHSKHPYPTDEEKDMLCRQTGLTKTQITNWLANTRRRNKSAIAHRSTSPGVRAWTNPPIDIPARRGTPALEQMNPLQRWQHSPPEHEPASVSDIARAIRSNQSLSSGFHSPYSANFTDDGTGRSLCDSNISSANTSLSSTDAYSHGSFSSWGSRGSLPRGRRRRRRRVAHMAPAAAAVPQLGPPKTFQCTFCTETFRTKHDWQRHEKSLHLSLERWVCSPHGPQALNPENGQMACVFCGQPNPDEAHMDGHNYAACQERTVGERTFYRKDHLRQHLKLVHDAKFLPWSMDPWKAPAPEIRSRCGFCGILLNTWSSRVDHLADHFKKGKSMADWKGDWGFEPAVLDMVENSIPPYLIHDERNSPNPYEASRPVAASARHAFELVISELTYYIDDWREKHGAPPSDEELQRAACALICDSEEPSEATQTPSSSWLRDLIFSSERLAQDARWSKSKGVECWQQLKINGKKSMFELDPMELELQEFVRARRLLDLSVSETELQAEACRIIQRMGADNSNPSSAHAVNFFLRLAGASVGWLAAFRQRCDAAAAGSTGELPGSDRPPPAPVAEPGAGGWCLVSRSPCGSGAPSTEPRSRGALYLSDANCYQRLARELKKWVAATMSPNNPNCHVPSDDELQHQARWIIYEDDDPWNQTAADNYEWLRRFKRDVGLINDTSVPGLPPTLGWNMTQGGSGFSPPYIFPNPSKASQMTPFPELPTATTTTNPASAAACSSSSSFPPTSLDRTITPSTTTAASTTATSNNIIDVTFRPGCKPIPARTSTANRFVRSLADTRRHDPPPSVFCSRELERALIEFVTAEVVSGKPFPSAEQIREQARQVLGPAAVGGLGGWTPAEDAAVLGKFVEVMKKRLGLGEKGGGVEGQRERQRSREAPSAEMWFGFGLGVGTGTPAPLDFSSSSSSDAGAGAQQDSLQQMLGFDFGDMGDFLGIATGGMPMD